MQEHIQWPLKSTGIISSSSKDTACRPNKLWKGQPTNKEDFLMTSKLLVRPPFQLPRGRTGAKDTLGSVGRLAGDAGDSHTLHSPSSRDWQGELHGTFHTKASHRKQGAASPTLLTWQFGHYRSQTGALAGTPRHLVLCRHRGRWSLF